MPREFRHKMSEILGNKEDVFQVNCDQTYLWEDKNNQKFSRAFRGICEKARIKSEYTSQHPRFCFRLIRKEMEAGFDKGLMIISYL